MATSKYLSHINGRLTEVVPVIVGAVAASYDKIPALDASGRLDVTMLPVGAGPEVSIVLASEAIAAGNFVNIYDNAGTANCRNADSTVAGKEAHGFVLAAVASAANATVYFTGENTQRVGLTVGTQYLAAAGSCSTTPPTTAGHLVQGVGFATTPTSMIVEFSNPITLA